MYVYTYVYMYIYTYMHAYTPQEQVRGFSCPDIRQVQPSKAKSVWLLLRARALCILAPHILGFWYMSFAFRGHAAAPFSLSTTRYTHTHTHLSTEAPGKLQHHRNVCQSTDSTRHAKLHVSSTKTQIILVFLKHQQPSSSTCPQREIQMRLQKVRGECTLNLRPARKSVSKIQVLAHIVRFGL